MKYILLICICLIHSSSFAERFSYIYIQGDKEIPFYVKLDDEMLTRYGKNYCIVSELSPGPAKIQILFQQNEYAPQNFVIQVPENGFRGFLLTNKNGQFSLYDIHQQFYLPAGNKADEDRMPMMTSRIKEINIPTPPPAVKTPAAKTSAPLKKPVVEKTIKPLPEATKKETPKTDTKVPVNTPAVPRPVTPRPVTKPATTNTTEPKFLDDVELKNSRTQSQESNINTQNTNQPKAHIINSDCPKAMTAMDFNSIYNGANEQTGPQKVKYILEQMNYCYSTYQASELAGLLNSDAERYTVLKRIYARITDQENFANLEKLFTDNEWKGYFKALIK